MRARSLKPGFFKNEALADLPPLTRILFAGLWGMADREGRLEDRPRKIKAEVLPFDNCNVDKMLDALASSPEHFIARYEADNTRYIAISNFLKHQSPHIKEVQSTIPAPDEHGAGTIPAPEPHQSPPSSRARSDSGLLTPSSLTPSSLTPDSGLRTAEEHASVPAEPVENQDDFADIDFGEEPPRPDAKVSAQTLTAFYVDAMRAKDQVVTTTDKARFSRTAKEVLEQGCVYDVARAAVERMVEKGLGIHLLGSVCNEVKAGPRTRGRADPSRVPDNVAAALAIVAEEEARCGQT